MRNKLHDFYEALRGFKMPNVIRMIAGPFLIPQCNA